MLDDCNLSQEWLIGERQSLSYTNLVENRKNSSWITPNRFSELQNDGEEKGIEKEVSHVSNSIENNGGPSWDSMVRGSLKSLSEGGAIVNNSLILSASLEREEKIEVIWEDMDLDEWDDISYSEKEESNEEAVEDKETKGVTK